MATRTILLAISLALFALPSMALYKCKKPDGSVSFQDIPCPTEHASEKLKSVQPNTIGPASERPDHIRAAIAAKRPAVGMTVSELRRAIGDPDKVNAAQYGSEFKDQLIYYTATRTLYVYTTNGVVTAIQDTDGGRPSRVSSPAPYVTPTKPCPSRSEIRDIEMEISRISNRDKPRVLAELHRQLGEARACGR